MSTEGGRHGLSEHDLDHVRAVVTSGGILDDDLVFRLAPLLDERLSADQQAGNEVTDMLDRRLRPPFEPSTWLSIETSLVRLLDDEASGLFLSWLLTDPTEERIAMLDAKSEPAAAKLVQRLRARFGHDIDAAAAHMNLGSEDWLRVDRLVYLNQETGLPGARTTIRKVNGETLVVEGNANSLLGLTRVLLEAVRAFDSATVFGEQERDAFLAMLEEVRAMLSHEISPSYGAPDDSQPPDLGWSMR